MSANIHDDSDGSDFLNKDGSSQFASASGSEEDFSLASPAADPPARPIKLKVTADKTPLAPITAKLAKQVQVAIGRARTRIDDWRQKNRNDGTEFKRDSNHTVSFVEGLGFRFGRLANGEEVAIRFVNGMRHPDTGFNLFAVVSKRTAIRWSSSRYKDHKWFARRSTTGHCEIRLQPPTGGLNKSILAARAIYELENSHVVGKRHHRVVIGERSDLRNGLDLRLSNLELETPAGRRTSKKTPKPPSLEDLRAEIDALMDFDDDVVGDDEVHGGDNHAS